jgi:hypothetical protein
LFLNDGQRLDVEEESCCSAHSTLVSDQNTTFTAVKLHGKVTTLKGTKLETWPARTEVACWYDTYPFTTVPVPLPHHFDQQKKAFVVYGNLCSVECALAYMHRESRRHDLWERVVLFEDMMHKVFKIKTVGSEPAPPFLTLTRFGGFYSIDEYRASFTTIKMTVIAPPFLMYPLVIQEKHKSIESAREVVHDETALSTGHVLRGLRRPQKGEEGELATLTVEGTVTDLVMQTSLGLVGDGPLTVQALHVDSDSSSDEDILPADTAVPLIVLPLTVPPLSSMQMDTEFFSRLSKSNRGKGRGRGRGQSRQSAPVGNTMLTNFLINK